MPVPSGLRLRRSCCFHLGLSQKACFLDIFLRRSVSELSRAVGNISYLERPRACARFGVICYPATDNQSTPIRMFWEESECHSLYPHPSSLYSSVPFCGPPIILCNGHVVREEQGSHLHLLRRHWKKGAGSSGTMQPSPTAHNLPGQVRSPIQPLPQVGQFSCAESKMHDYTQCSGPGKIEK